MLFRIFLVILLAVCVYGGFEAWRRHAEKDIAAGAAPAIVPDPIVGYAVQSENGEWCVVTRRPDIKEGWSVTLLWPEEKQAISTQLGEQRAACLPKDAASGEKSFSLKEKTAVPSTRPAMVIGQMAWQRTDNGFVGEFDRVPGLDRITYCAADDTYHLFVIGDATRAGFYRGLPLSAGVEPCDPTQTRIIAEHLPVRPIIMPYWSYNMETFSSRSQWLVLTISANGDALSTTGVQTVQTEGACADTSDTLAPNPYVAYRYLFANLPITAGPVEGARFLTEYDRDGYADPDSIVIVFRNDTTIVRRKHEDGMHVSLYSQGRVIPLYDTDFEDEGRAYVEWAGDLDRDGQLDIVLSATSKYSVRAIYLFLSKQRTLNKWPVAAEYAQAGC
jgi:hypothetical protein